MDRPKQAMQTHGEQRPLLRHHKEIEQPKFLNGTSRSRFWVIYSQILLAQFVTGFDTTIMASSHPVITSFFGAANSASWLSTSFLLTSTALAPLLARLSDTFGRRCLFLGCLWVLTIGTFWCALANSIGTLIFARSVCGCGAGGMLTVSSIMVSDLVPNERRGLYQPYTNLVYGAGCALGAALGGTMAETLGWRSEFGTQVPVMLLCIGVSTMAIPSTLGRQELGSLWVALKDFDVIGSLLLSTATTAVILSLNLGGNNLPWAHPFILACIAYTVCAVPMLLWVESRALRPVLPLALLSSAPRTNLLFSNFLVAMVSYSVLFNMPLFYQAVLLMSATASGFRLMLPSIVTSAASAMTGYGIVWTGRLKWPLMCRSWAYLVGLAYLCVLQRSLPPIAPVTALVPMAVGQGLQFPGTLISILVVSPQCDQAVVTSTLLLFRNLGMVLGVASSSLIVQNALRHYLDEFVHGERRDEVIHRVRVSVQAVAELAPPYREQAVRSYESSLRLVFLYGLALSTIAVVILLPVKLPRLRGAKA